MVLIWLVLACGWLPSSPHVCMAGTGEGSQAGERAGQQPAPAKSGDGLCWRPSAVPAGHHAPDFVLSVQKIDSHQADPIAAAPPRHQASTRRGCGSDQPSPDVQVPGKCPSEQTSCAQTAGPGAGKRGVSHRCSRQPDHAEGYRPRQTVRHCQTQGPAAGARSQPASQEPSSSAGLLLHATSSEPGVKGACSQGNGVLLWPAQRCPGKAVSLLQLCSTLETR